MKRRGECEDGDDDVDAEEKIEGEFCFIYVCESEKRFVMLAYNYRIFGLVHITLVEENLMSRTH